MYFRYWLLTIWLNDSVSDIILFQKFCRACLLVSWLVAEYTVISPAVFCSTTPTSTICVVNGKGKDGKFHMGQSLPKCNLFFFCPQCFIMSSFKHYLYAYHLSSTINIFYVCIIYIILFTYIISPNHGKL